MCIRDRFSKPLTNYGFWSADIPEHWVRKRDEVVSIPYLTRVSPVSYTHLTTTKNVKFIIQ